MPGILQTIERTLANGSLGQPVGLRVVAYEHRHHEPLAEQAATIGRVAERWLNDSISGLAAIESNNRAELSVLLRFQRGGSALVSCGHVTEAAACLELTLFGNRGTANVSRVAGLGAPWTDVDDQVRQLALQIQATTVSEALQPKRSTSSLRDEAASISPCQPPFGVLLIAGDHTHQPGYAAAFAADPRCELIAVSDEANVEPRRKDLNRRFADRLRIPYIDDLATALARDDIDIASICAEPRRRARIIVAAAAAGKHLYLDKPLCARADELDLIGQAVAQADIVAHMFSQVHWEPTRRAQGALSTGQVGSLQAIHTDLCFAKGYAGTAELGHARQEQAAPEIFEMADAKRELTNVGVYNVVLLLHLLGRQVDSVSAQTGNYFFAEHQQRDMEDFGQVLMRLDDGTIASATAARTGWRSHPSGGLNRVCLLGDVGATVVDAHRPRLEVWADDEPWQAPPRDPEDPMGMWASPAESPHRPREKRDWVVADSASWTTDASHFLDCIEQGQPSAVPIQIAIEASRVLLSAYRSAATGTTVRV
jgi:predicted dehydrogenase